MKRKNELVKKHINFNLIVNFNLKCKNSFIKSVNAKKGRKGNKKV
jgi:hypothetical protein